MFPQRSRPALLMPAAWGGLKSAPDSRLRRASRHLLYSLLRRTVAKPFFARADMSGENTDASGRVTAFVPGDKSTIALNASFTNVSGAQFLRFFDTEAGRATDFPVGPDGQIDTLIKDPPAVLVKALHDGNSFAELHTDQGKSLSGLTYLFDTSWGDHSPQVFAVRHHGDRHVRIRGDARRECHRHQLFLQPGRCSFRPHTQRPGWPERPHLLRLQRAGRQQPVGHRHVPRYQPPSEPLLRCSRGPVGVLHRYRGERRRPRRKRPVPEFPE